MRTHSFEIEYKDGDAFKYLEVDFEFIIVGVESHLGYEYTDVDELIWDKTKYTEEENKIIEKFCEEEKDYIDEKILEYYTK